MKSRTHGAFRFNPIIAIGAIGLVAIVVILFMIGQSPEAAAKEFMVALSKGDVAKLTEMSWLPDPVAPVDQQWKETFESKAKNYMFGWELQGSDKARPGEAVVKVVIIEFRGPETYEKDLANLPLVKKNGEWKVNLRSLTRQFFPGLPR